MGRRCTGRGCVLCDPSRKGERQRKIEAIRFREQRRELGLVLAGMIVDDGPDYSWVPVTLTRGVW